MPDNLSQLTMAVKIQFLGRSVHDRQRIAGANAAEQEVESMIREGVASWDGGKPAGASRPRKVAGRSVADTVIEERR
jgi:hypothetical protein